MSLYMQTDKPASANRIRLAGSRDVFSSPDGNMNKRIPRNAKYANIKATIDTGANAGNVKPKVDRSGEMFRRVNRRQLHQLMLACEQGDESIYALQENWDNIEDLSETSSVRSGRTNTSTMSGMSATGSVMPIVATHTQTLHPAAPSTPQANEHFLLLDMREDEAEYRKAHVQGALHYPPAMLRRDHFPPVLYKFKNAAEKLIIVYDSDETSRAAMDAAVLFIQKGFSNVFLLTGGLRHFAEKYTSRMAGEQPPKAAVAAAATKSGTVSNRSQALAGTPASGRPMLSGAGESSRGSTGAAAAASAAGSGASSYRSTASAAGAPSFAARPGATQLGGGRFAPPSDRESPRAALHRTQQSQQQQQQQQRQQQVPPSAARGHGGAGAGGQPISSRPFR